MIYAIKRTDFSGSSWWLLPACFDSAAVVGRRIFHPRPISFHSDTRRCWVKDESPAKAMKWSEAASPAAVCEALGGGASVVPLEGTGREYELPSDPRADETLAYRILTRPVTNGEAC